MFPLLLNRLGHMSLMDQKKFRIIHLVLFTNLCREAPRWPISSPSSGASHQHRSLSSAPHPRLPNALSLFGQGSDSLLREPSRITLEVFMVYDLIASWTSFPISDHSLQLYICVIITFCLHTYRMFYFCIPVFLNTYHRYMTYECQQFNKALQIAPIICCE